MQDSQIMQAMKMSISAQLQNKTQGPENLTHLTTAICINQPAGARYCSVYKLPK